MKEKERKIYFKVQVLTVYLKFTLIQHKLGSGLMPTIYTFIMLVHSMHFRTER